MSPLFPVPENSRIILDGNKEVFILGSGFNNEIRDENERQPPRSKNFIPDIIRESKFCNLEQLFEPVLKEMKTHWNKVNIEELKKEESTIDLEDCITHFEKMVDDPCYAHIKYSSVLLKTLICNVLNKFARLFLIRNANAMKKVANKIWESKSPIITFNYDVLTEIALELVSENNWQRKTAYMINFAGEVTPDDLILNKINFDKNINPILKLHGSVNWFKFPQLAQLKANSMGGRPFSHIPDDANFPSLSKKLFYSPREDFLTLFNMFPNYSRDSFVDYISPQIITPVLYKRRYYALSPFKALWKNASDILMQCHKAVTIGYSFPRTDVNIWRLFSKATRFGELKEIDVVDPDDERICGQLKCRYPNLKVTPKGPLEKYANSLV